MITASTTPWTPQLLYKLVKPSFITYLLTNIDQLQPTYTYPLGGPSECATWPLCPTQRGHIGGSWLLPYLATLGHGHAASLSRAQKTAGDESTCVFVESKEHGDNTMRILRGR